MNKGVSRHTEGAINCINKVSLTWLETGWKKRDLRPAALRATMPWSSSKTSTSVPTCEQKIPKAGPSTGQFTEGEAPAHHKYGEQEHHEAEIREDRHLKPRGSV